MSMLSEVNRDLLANKRISIVDIKVSGCDPAENSFETRCEAVDILVAPKKGVYEADALQALMEQLTPSVKWTSADRFIEGDHSLSFGVLYFDEEIGREKRFVRREITLHDPDFLSKNLKRFVEGKCLVETNIEIALERRTWVRLYPNVNVALRAAGGKDVFSITKKNLVACRGRFARMLASLGFRP